MNENCVARRLASAIDASNRCHERGNLLWRNRWTEYVEQIMTHAPSGSGFDSGTKLVEEECSSKALVFTTSFHHMDEHGSYDGWTEHKVFARPDFIFGILVTVSGPNKNDIKAYITDRFHYWLNEPAPPYPWENDNADHSEN